MIIIIIRQIDPLKSADNAIINIETKQYYHGGSNSALNYGNNQPCPWAIFTI